MSGLLLVAAAATLALGRGKRSWLLPLLGATAVWPLPAALGWSTAALGMSYRRLRKARRRRERAEADEALLAELLSLGVAGGLSLPQAFGLAGPYLGPDLRQETAELERRARVEGLAAALTQTSGHGSELYRNIARSVVTGAPLHQTLQAFVTDANRAQRARERERAKRLPLRVMVPVALLILPGFVMLSLGPAIVGSLERLTIP